MAYKKSSFLFWPINNGKIYYGLKNRIQRFASDREYELIDQTNDLVEKFS